MILLVAFAGFVTATVSGVLQAGQLAVKKRNVCILMRMIYKPLQACQVRDVCRSMVTLLCTDIMLPTP